MVYCVLMVCRPLLSARHLYGHISSSCPLVRQSCYHQLSIQEKPGTERLSTLARSCGHALGTDLQEKQQSPLVPVVQLLLPFLSLLCALPYFVGIRDLPLDEVGCSGMMKGSRNHQMVPWLCRETEGRAVAVP